jgi:YggT family protein
LESIANIILILTRVLTVIILGDVLVSFILDPYHPIRQALDAVVQPLLAPIRRIMPPVGMFDLSPLVLLVLVEMVGRFFAALIA